MSARSEPVIDGEGDVGPTTGTPGDLVLSLQGELDVSTSGALQRQLACAIASGVSRIVLIFDQVSFCDCATLGAVMGAHRALQDRGGGELVIRGATGMPKRLLALSDVIPPLQLEP